MIESKLTLMYTARRNYFLWKDHENDERKSIITTVCYCVTDDDCFHDYTFVIYQIHITIKRIIGSYV